MRLAWKRWYMMVLTAAVAVLLWCFLGSKYALEATNYVISSSKLTAPIRIVQLSDLHNSEFGKANTRLVRMVEKQQPDLIVMTGDMINGNAQKTEIGETLIAALAELAPVYASFGNHEKAHEHVYGIDVKTLYEREGAVVLDKTYQDIEIRGQRIRIGGLLGYALPEKYTRSGEAVEEEYTYIAEMQETESLTLLLCHYPTCWIQNNILDDWHVDVVFSGHEHGGQIRLPWLGGLYAPDRGLFPGNTSGVLYAQDGKRALVLSRGLGSSGRIPRLNNVPEIVVVDIIAENNRSQ